MPRTRAWVEFIPENGGGSGCGCAQAGHDVWASARGGLVALVWLVLYVVTDPHYEDRARENVEQSPSER
jgi:hypothetical protein